VDALGLTRGLDSELNVLHWILVTGQPRRLTAAQADEATEQCAEVLNAFWSTCLASLSKYKFAVLTVPVGNLDVTDHWHLEDGTGVEILTFLDDHSRFVLSVRAYPTTTMENVRRLFAQSCERHGTPASVLTDNGHLQRRIARRTERL
jgi:transposase InsO family protein